MTPITYDLATAAAISGTAALFCAATTYYFSFERQARLRSAAVAWSTGYLLFAAAFLIIAFRSHLAPWVPPVVANGLLVLSFVPMLIALRRVTSGSFSRIAVMGLAMAAICVVEQAWYVRHDAYVNTRLVIGLLCQVAVTLPLIATAFTMRRKVPSGGPLIIATAYSLYLAVLIQRLVMLGYGPSLSDVFDQPTAQTISYAMCALLPVLSTLGFLQLLSAVVVEDLSARAAQDPLTGCLNRRTLEERARAAIASARRNKDELTCVVLDVNHLKVINDTNGHAAGDEALCSFAQECQKRLRPRDLLARTGGDEFVCVMQSSEGDARASVAELQERLGRLDFNWTHEMKLSAAAGFATLEPTDDLSSLMLRADQDMYRAKRTAHLLDGRVAARIIGS